MTTETWILIAACAGSGMMAGLFGAFSTFMMKALGSLPAAGGIQTMQAINRFIQRPSFFLVFFGTGVLCAIAAWLCRDMAGGVAFLTLVAAILYIVFCLFTTIAFNVPLNNRLDAADSDSTEGHAFWKRYLLVWTRWNHVRSAATLISAFLLALAISRLE